MSREHPELDSVDMGQTIDEALSGLSRIKATYEKQARAKYGRSAQQCSWREIFVLPPPCKGKHFPDHSEEQRRACEKWYSEFRRTGWGCPFPKTLDKTVYFCLMECRWSAECWDGMTGRIDPETMTVAEIEEVEI